MYKIPKQINIADTIDIVVRVCFTKEKINFYLYRNFSRFSTHVARETSDLDTIMRVDHNSAVRILQAGIARKYKDIYV